MGEYTDDGTITDDAALWRRIPSRWLVRDEPGGGLRISSAAFSDHSDGSPMSILIADIMVEHGRGPSHALGGHEDFALASITAGYARACRQGVLRDPLPDEPAHGVVFGNKTKSIRKKLAKGASWVIPPREERVN